LATVAVVGLGYVGLPLAVEFGKGCRTIGFDLSEEKVSAYCRQFDPTGEVSRADFKAARRARGRVAERRPEET
jgi:UDP-N-acetyl-D-galactosamine dehydrogenase